MKTITSILSLLILVSCAHSSRKAIDQKFEQILHDHREWELNEYPEWATYEGRHENDHLFSDHSLAAVSKRHKIHLELSAKLKAIPSNLLSPENQLNYQLFLEQLEQTIESHQYPSEYLVLNQLGNFLNQVSRLFEVMPKKTLKDERNILSRLEAIPSILAIQQEKLQTGLAQGVTPPKAPLQNLGVQLRQFLEPQVKKNPLTLSLFKSTLKTSAAFEQQAQDQFDRAVLPAIKKFTSFLETAYLPRLRDDVSWTALPQGESWYKFLVRTHTTTSMSPEEIHQLGLTEVERIEQAMTKLAVERAGFKNLKAYKKHLLEHPQYFFQSAQDLVLHYQALCKRIDEKIGSLFKTLPRTPYGVIAMPDPLAVSSPTALYMGGHYESGRSGLFYVNTTNLMTRPRWESEALALHEAVPGHHLQISLAQEMQNVPEFRKRSRYTAFVEGWGLYAEALGLELGFYQEPSSDFGRLSFEMWRAVRLVVDTGLHAKGWSREQAINYFIQKTGRPGREAHIEVDRYIVRPGQALAYKIGELKIWELRKKAETRLKENFNIREFHDVILAQGAVSLSTLEQIVEDWLLTASNSN